MNPGNKTEATRFTRAIAGMAATFRQEATKAMFTGYQMGLADMDMDTIEAAVVRGIRECKFMPSAADLRELAGMISASQRAMIAWSILGETMKRLGDGPTIDFDDPILNATVRGIGGWVTMFDLSCGMSLKEWENIFQRRFTDLYQALCANGISEEQAAYLPGSHERNNRLHGYLDHIPEPIRIACNLPKLRVGAVRPLLDVQRKLTHTLGALP